MLDYLAQFPIRDEDATIASLQQEAMDETRAMALKLGYAVAGDPEFEVLDLPLGMYLQCRVPVEVLDFGGARVG